MGRTGPGPVDRSEGFRWAGLAQGLSIKVKGLPKREGPKRGEIGGAVPVARFLAAGLQRLGLRGLAWLIEARGQANGSEGLGWPGPVDKSEGFRWAGLAQGPSIKVRNLGGRAGPGPVDKSEGFRWAGPAQGPSIKVRDWGAGLARACR